MQTLAVLPRPKRLPYNRAIAQRFCDLISSSHDSIFDLLKKHPDLPDWKTLHCWRESKPEFADAWRKAREQQAHYLVQYSLILAAQATPKNAHAVRVRFDIYKWIASKFNPQFYGDKPPTTQTTVNVGLNISAERLNEIRSKLDITRDSINDRQHPNGNTIHATSGETGKTSTQPLLKE